MTPAFVFHVERGALKAGHPGPAATRLSQRARESDRTSCCA